MSELIRCFFRISMLAPLTLKVSIFIYFLDGESGNLFKDNVIKYWLHFVNRTRVWGLFITPLLVLLLYYPNPKAFVNVN